MVSEEYKNASGGGGLKLKGVKGAKVGKHKKKKKPADEAAAAETDALGKAEQDEPADGDAPNRAPGTEYPAAKSTKADQDAEPVVSTKTEAERRHEELRRKRLDERLKREGVKTHKERVEELNRYLSNLSEHHDMPRIGPG